MGLGWQGRRSLFVVLILLSFGAAASEPPQSSAPPAASASPASAPAASAAPSKAPAEEEQRPRTAPRQVTLPAFQIVSPLALQGSGSDKAAWPRGKTYEYGASRFTVIVVLASWSQRAQEVALRLKGWEAEFSRRSVSIVGIFTHDSPEDILNLIKRTQLNYPVAKVDLAFVAALLNPKVPTMWIVDHDGQIVFRTERPSDTQVAELRTKLLKWTDF